MEELAEQKPKTFGEALNMALVEQKDTLPKDFNIGRFTQNALSLINDNPSLKKYDKKQLMAGLMLGARLDVDFYMKQAYLIPYGQTINFQLDYKGLMKICKKYSIRPIREIKAELVRKGDEFIVKKENGNDIVSFTPVPFSDEEIVGVFAVIVFEDGGCQCETMNKREIEVVKSKSKSGGAVWRDFYGEMAKKAVIRRICKTVELEFENNYQSKIWNDDATGDIATEPAPVDNPFGDDDADVIDVESREV